MEPAAADDTTATDAASLIGSNNIVWGTVGSDNIVWGTTGAGNIVWGTTLDGNILWQSNAEFAASLGVAFLDQLNDDQIFALLEKTAAVDHPDATVDE